MGATTAMVPKTLVLCTTLPGTPSAHPVATAMQASVAQTARSKNAHPETILLEVPDVPRAVPAVEEVHATLKPAPATWDTMETSAICRRYWHKCRNAAV